MTFISSEDAVACCRQCRKVFDSENGAKIHYGQKHEPLGRECVTCGEWFTTRHAEQKKQCLECLQTHGHLGRATAD